MEHCKNCQNPLSGKFCPACGQKADTRRFTFRDIFIELRKQYIQLDRGLIHTIIQLAVRPGHALRDFVKGKRLGFTPALKFLFWTAAIGIFLMHYFGLDQQLIEGINNKYLGENGEGRKFGLGFSNYIFSNPGLVMLLMIPGISLVSLLFYRRKGYNLAEHFILNCYLMGEISLTGLISSAVAKTLGTHNPLNQFFSIVSFLLWIAYIAWAYRQFFQEKNVLLTFFKVMFLIPIGFLVFVLLFSILMTIFLSIWVGITGAPPT